MLSIWEIFHSELLGMPTTYVQFLATIRKPDISMGLNSPNHVRTHVWPFAEMAGGNNQMGFLLGVAEIHRRKGGSVPSDSLGRRFQHSSGQLIHWRMKRDRQVPKFRKRSPWWVYPVLMNRRLTRLDPGTRAGTGMIWASFATTCNIFNRCPRS